MKKVLLLAVLFLPVKLWATATVTVTLFQPAGGQPPNTYLRVDIQNCLTPRVPSTGFIMPKSQTFLPNKTTGIATAVIFENASVACGSIMGESYYTFFVVQNGTATSLGSYSVIAGGYDLSALPPLNPLPPPSNPNSPPIPVAPPAYAIQFANGSVNGVQADSHITINPETHTLNAPNLSVANLSSQTTITSPLGFIGALTGDVTGNLHGNADTATSAATATTATNATTAFHAENIPADFATQSATAPSSAKFTDQVATNSSASPQFNNVYFPAQCANTLHPTWCAGSDIGSWVNAAIAQVTNSGVIEITPGTYTQTTTMFLPNLLVGAIELKIDTGAVLNYSGSDWSIEWFVNPLPNNLSGIRIMGGGTIVGTNSAKGALHVLVSESSVISGIQIRGFGGANSAAILNDGADVLHIENTRITSNSFGVLLRGVMCATSSVFQGTANVSGTAVTWLSGTNGAGTTTNFSSIFAGQRLRIGSNGQVYTVASVGSSTSLTLTTSAGTQTAAAYSTSASCIVARTASGVYTSFFAPNAAYIHNNQISSGGTGIQIGDPAGAGPGLNNVVDMNDLENDTQPIVVGDSSGAHITSNYFEGATNAYIIDGGLGVNTTGTYINGNHFVTSPIDSILLRSTVGAVIEGNTEFLAGQDVCFVDALNPGTLGIYVGPNFVQATNSYCENSFPVTSPSNVVYGAPLVGSTAVSGTVTSSCMGFPVTINGTTPAMTASIAAKANLGNLSMYPVVQANSVTVEICGTGTIPTTTVNIHVHRNYWP